MNAPLPNGSSALLAFFAAVILLTASFAAPAWTATGSTSIPLAPSTPWESSGSGLELPYEQLDPGPPSKPQLRMRLSLGARTIDAHPQSRQF